MSKNKIPKQHHEDIDNFYRELEKAEEHLIKLIVEIIVDSTLRKYYEDIDVQNSQKEK